ncbi:MAG: LacI family DNA-binding transcriptional regulator [bacterium]
MILMVTIYDVAKKAEVSPATVSRVINNKSNVKPETRKRIEEVCEELNYVPNSNAGSLKKKHTKSLGLIIPEISNPFFISILKGFENRAIQSGYNTILCNTAKNTGLEENYIQMILEKRIDGVAISTVSKNHNQLKKIKQQDIPLILIDRKIEDFKVDIVCGDSYHGAVKLVNHLIQKGHKNIAMIAGPRHLSTGKERILGYKKALAEANITFKPELLKVISSRYQGFSRKKAYELTRSLISGNSSFSAIFVANNLMALGAYKALTEAGINVPGDIALVCFDDLSLEFEINPFFTVMKQPAPDMGKTAAEILIDKIEGKNKGKKQKVVFQPELIVRRSSGE